MAQLSQQQAKPAEDDAGSGRNFSLCDAESGGTKEATTHACTCVLMHGCIFACNPVKRLNTKRDVRYGQVYLCTQAGSQTPWEDLSTGLNGG